MKTLLHKILKTKLLKSKKRRLPILFGSLFITWYIFCLPSPLFNDPTSTLLFDRNNELLSAKIARDGQWRFPYTDSVPYKFEKCIVYFEDQYFYYHPGINPVSLLKALYVNIKEKKIVRGGSTLTAQVLRLSRKGKRRTVIEKLIEFIQATRLEIKHSKKEILALYSSNAPFGGNVVGLYAAAWRYYGRSPCNLSWGESATLAVLPNAPGLIYPGKGHEKLLAKRNRLLDKLCKEKIIDSTTCELAKLEQLPNKPKPLPMHAPHLLNRIIKDGNEGKSVKVTVDRNFQRQSNRIIEKYHKVLAENEIANAAVIVLNVENGNVLAYVGNTSVSNDNDGQHVDIISSLRSSGSTLKPFLYAFMLKEGEILPHTLIADIPTQISGFSPKNFNKRFDGAVPANNALARSLNIPAVRMLREHGLNKFHSQIQNIGITTINKHPNHYGLSLILGGAEVTLWELSATYANLARMLNNYVKNSSEYSKKNYHTPNYYYHYNTAAIDNWENSDPIGAGPAYLTFQALTEMTRPIDGSNWQVYSSSKRIAWKTGTSFGHRDAWAVGVTPGYVVGVWVGNADGEGRPGLTGASTAAPIMFDVFRILPETGWFTPPYDDLIKIKTCKRSGYKAGTVCPETDSIYISPAGIRTGICPYHKKVFLNEEKNFRVSSNCYKVKDMVVENWFVLPPIMEWFYKSHDPFYKTLPPMDPKCESVSNNMELIYPQIRTNLYIPHGFGGKKQKSVFEAAHRIPEATIHWHLDNTYLGSTTTIHQMEVDVEAGEHTITVVSDDGESIERKFWVLSR